jgi:hypothetical protein
MHSPEHYLRRLTREMALLQALQAATAAIVTAQSKVAADITQTVTDFKAAMQFNGGNLTQAQAQPLLDQLNASAAALNASDVALTAADPTVGLVSGKVYQLKTDPTLTATYNANDAGTVVTPANLAGQAITFGGADNWTAVAPPPPPAPALPAGVSLGG